MPRRTPKSFTVEVRKSGRLVKAAAASWPDAPLTTDDQPRVSWPGLEDASEPAAEAQEAAIAPESSTGRVLPALDEPEPIVEPIVPKRRGRVRAKSSAGVTKQPSAEAVTLAPGIPLAVEEPCEAATITPSAKIMTDALRPRDGRKRMPRDELNRAERWKARLPIAVFRRTKRRRITP